MEEGRGVMWMRIIKQELFPEGVLTTYENGEQKLIPYDPDGGVDLDPNGEIFEEFSC